MTIRYTCEKCESVLKIKDEKAGTEGKCPKCKTKFLIPAPEADSGADETDMSELSEDQVDMPLELTPAVEDMEDFDPMDVLADSSSAAKKKPAPAVSDSTAENRPSVAELMRDFEATKKPKEKKASAAKSKQSASMETIGTAADALSRRYQQKRNKASEPEEPKKEVDPERELMYDFIKKAALGVLAIFVLSYGLIWWMNQETYEGPPLAEATGIVTQNGQPLVGVQVSFKPIPGPDQQGMSTSSSMTDEEGRFRLKLTDQFSGVAIGTHNVIIFDKSGIPMALPPEIATKTVTEDGPNEFQFNL